MPRKVRTSNGEEPPAPNQLNRPKRKSGPVTLQDVENVVRRSLDTHRYTPWFDTHAAAAYLRREPGTLKGWRSKGEGPRFHTVNDKFIRYHLNDLDDFVRGKATNTQ